MTDTKEFGLGTILSITDGHLVCDMTDVYAILNWMTGDNLFTHQLPRASRECEGPLRAQFPTLAQIKVPALGSEQEYVDWLAGQEKIYGSTFAVAPLATDEHTSIDPLTELAMNHPDVNVVPVVIDNDVIDND